MTVVTNSWYFNVSNLMSHFHESDWFLNMMGATYRTGGAYRSGAHEVTQYFFVGLLLLSLWFSWLFLWNVVCHFGVNFPNVYEFPSLNFPFVFFAFLSKIITNWTYEGKSFAHLCLVHVSRLSWTLFHIAVFLKLMDNKEGLSIFFFISI